MGGVVEELSLSVSLLLFPGTPVPHQHCSSPLFLAQVFFPTHTANLSDPEILVGAWDHMTFQAGPHCLCWSQHLLYLDTIWLSQSVSS